MSSNNALVQFYRWVFGVGHERNVGGVERTIRYTAGALSLLAAVAVVAGVVDSRFSFTDARKRIYSIGAADTTGLVESTSGPLPESL